MERNILSKVVQCLTDAQCLVQSSDANNDKTILDYLMDYHWLWEKRFVVRLNESPPPENPGVVAFAQLLTTWDEVQKWMCDICISRHNDDDRHLPKFQVAYRDQLRNKLVNDFKAEGVSIAWRKCYEIVHVFKMIDLRRRSTRVLALCEAPGNFILALNHYCALNNVRMTWIAETLVGKDGIGDDYGLMAKYKSNWDYGVTKDGDLYSLANVRYFSQLSANFITSDCGLDCSDDLMCHETRLMRLLWSQLAIILGALVNNGATFFKIFTWGTPAMQTLLYIMYKSFGDVQLVKPVTSRRYSNEVYVVAKFYNKSVGQQYYNNVMQFLTTLCDADDIKTAVPRNIIVPDAFITKLYYALKLFGIRVMIASYLNSYTTLNYDKLDAEMIYQMNRKNGALADEWIRHMQIRYLQNHQRLL